MAYGLKYQAGWSSQSGVQGYLYIDEQDWAGGVTSIKLRRGFEDAFKIENQFKGWDDPIIGLTLSFTIVNDLPDFYTLLPLMTAVERQYRVRVEITTPSASARSLFQGFLNVDSVNQRYLHKKDISFVASSYLSKLEHFTSITIETLQNVTFINLIDDILSEIGAFNIRVNMSLRDDTEVYSAGQTVLNKTGINTEAFWEDNVERDDNLLILRKILKSFLCYLYWKDGYWYIESFEDMWDETPSYVEYTNGVSYLEGDTGAVVNLTRTKEDLHDLVFVEASQTLHVDPGFKQVILELPDTYLLLNLVIPLLLAAELDEVEAPFLSFPEPPLRTWQKYPAWDNKIFADGSFGSIQNSLKKWNPNVGNAFVFGSQDKYQGLHTSFRIQITSEETNLNLSFKQAGQGKLGGGLPFNIMSGTESSHYWSLRYKDSPRYLLWNDSDEAYEWVDGLTEATGWNEEVIPFDSWDKENSTVEFSKTLNLGEITAPGILELVLCIASFDIDSIVTFMLAEYTGDVLLTVNDELEPNEIEATSTNAFLNKKRLQIDLIDVPNINYTNGILRTALAIRTTEWYYAAAPSILKKLTDWFFTHKFQLYDSSKQRVFGSVKSVGEIALMSLFEDSGQSDKRFVAMGTAYYPLEDIWAVRLYEFDNTTVVVIT